MTAGQIITFLLFAVVAAITPGPSNLILTSTGAKVGLLRGLPCLAGVAGGMSFMMFIVAFGLGNVVLASPTLILILKVGGTGFLLWLAWKIATASYSEAPVEKRPLGFFGAAAFQWISPKSWLVSVSAVSVYLHPVVGAGVAFRQALGFGLLFLLAAAPSCFVWLAFGAGLQRLLSTKRTARIFNIAMGILLAGSVLLFIW
ncbi:LysE family translocator [Ktedonosporobacter rubrisoli]|uniref:LysE family translocator n=1 Tax=Ktedonosporobacter rubrisoli TaxID=2509675 RepID=A0A4P6JIL1_KTERU|nr:LysE family translocator [Ktedonosporobacter rubrisoli]QBD74917.1 LysE family translocator [Ktedonosporobacter rubrisoli]